MSDPIKRMVLEINQSLQVTLDPEYLIDIFSSKVNNLVPHQGVLYKNNELDVAIILGSADDHCCSYNLLTGDESLGKLTFYRNQPFTGTEISYLKQLLISLLYPLRNTLLYRSCLLLATADPLTGIANRGSFNDQMHYELSHEGLQDAAHSLIMIDIDHFKAVNDSHGHILGDKALQAVANMIHTCCKDNDLPFRYGGEEFVVFMRDTDLAEAQVKAEQIRSYIESHPCTCLEIQLNITVSIGGSVVKKDDSLETLVGRADQALYRAKESGRNRVCFEKFNNTREDRPSPITHS